MSTNEKFDGPLPDGWSGGDAVVKFWRGNFAHLYRVTRPCKTCDAEISIDVTKAALLGTKQNTGLALRNCPTCRAARKAGGVGSRGGTSRPLAEGGTPPAVAATPPVVAVTDETLLMANQVMKEELDGLYLVVKELRDRLAQYELQPAVRRAAENMPWEQNSC